MKTDLLIIDPQNSFCDPKGELYVKNADIDMFRLSEMIVKNQDKISNIRVTLDSHHYIHIAHPIWWQDKNDISPKPFTVIKSEDVTGDSPLWKARSSVFAKRSVEYVKALEAAGKVLCIWPPHCLIGSSGQAIYECLFDALIEWEKSQFNVADKIVKGSNIFTEQYSVFSAEIPDNDDPDTLMNESLIKRLDEADRILVAGEALDFCVQESLKHAIQFIKPTKFVLLTDAMSAINTEAGEKFVAEMKAIGMHLSKTSVYF